MNTSLIIGAGTIGTALADHLTADGREVTLASRSGSARGDLRVASLDATDAAAVTAAARGHEVIVLTTSPREYHRWPELWPPMLDAAVAAASSTGAKLLMMGNLYAYGEGSRMPMTEHSPLLATDSKGLVRKALWETALAAHERGDLRCAEVRASDYFGPGAGRTAQLGSAFFTPAIAGRRTSVFGSPTAAHSWAYLPDIVRTLAAVAESDDAWGRPWHVPTAAPMSRAEIIEGVNAITGLSATATPYARWQLRMAGLFSPAIRAANDSLYQFSDPFISAAPETERVLGVTATEWDQSLPATVDWYRARP